MSSMGSAGTQIVADLQEHDRRGAEQGQNDEQRDANGLHHQALVHLLTASVRQEETNRNVDATLARHGNSLQQIVGLMQQMHGLHQQLQQEVRQNHQQQQQQHQELQQQVVQQHQEIMQELRRLQGPAVPPGQ
ncbi:hypothetical protein GPECTOR_31g364 [Gonium pectorale]|uniref:Uncharacterized protein n=1 Tax=Gonium pectorale TaxID=33097 RepID=A0A150GF98_GONPE|nr:hypothetical protein GPECTOR_31g364 [Gonium pectorale]|eukprot:KXZ48000.1 hypothetical protein GPECTOR_31g364 [Gonium pectorale]